MIKILFATREELHGLVKKEVLKYKNEDIEFQVDEVIGSEYVKNRKFDYDIVIASGSPVVAFEKYHKHIRVVAIPISGYEIIKVISEVRAKYNPKKIALIGSKKFLHGTSELVDYFDIPLEIHMVETEEANMDAIEKSINNGVDHIIGALGAHRLCEKRGIPSSYICIGRQSIHQALETAVKLANAIEQERTKAQRIEIIMKYAHEGIIAVDDKLRVCLINEKALSLADLRNEQAVHKCIDDLLPSFNVKKVLKSGKTELGNIKKINQTMVTTNIVPVNVNGSLVGSVVTFQEVAKIQEQEQKIRKIIYEKGNEAKYTFEDIVGDSAAIDRAIKMARIFSKNTSNVLIIGETGTGKELFAQSIHNNSSRKNAPFVAINCGALPESLLESELFGYVQGAFSGAVKGGKQGLFEIAHRGTIFLDEIGEISLNLQKKLLRVLQEKEVRRVGGDKIIPIDVRVIAATNKDLKDMMVKGEFRNDLFYRINVLRINVPPLRDRGKDIVLIAKKILQEKNAIKITPEAEALFLKHKWYGNIRELINVCERLATLCLNEEDSREEVSIHEEDIVNAIDWEENIKPGSRDEEVPEKKEVLAACELEEINKEAILSILKDEKYNKTKAAKRLGISRSTLWRKIRKYNIDI